MFNRSLVHTHLTAPYVIVIGASAGGVAALLELVQALPGDVNAAVGVALHVGSRRSVLPELLSARGVPARHARDGDALLAGEWLVAPPDHHLLFTPDAARLSRGPRENHARPAIDPMFRTAALAWRERCIGVVLSGDLDDGTAGLAAIKQCGGIAIVQDPLTALQPSMPQSALANVEVDHCLDIPGIARLLHSLAARAPGDIESQRPVPEHVLRENAVAEGNITTEQAMENLSELGTPSSLTCPECGGALWELKKNKPLRYRCHTGHGYTASSLENSQNEIAEQAMWNGVRALREREMLLRRLASVSEATGDAAQAAAGRREADRVHVQAEELIRMIETESTRASTVDNE